MFLKLCGYFFSHNVMFLLLKLLIHLVIVAPIPVRLAAKDYLVRNVNPTLLKGLTELCKQKPKDPVVSWYFLSYGLIDFSEYIFELTW